MERFITQMIERFERGALTRRQLIQTIAVAATAYGTGAELEAAPTLGLKTISVNHISYGAPDYTKARDFYVKLLGMDYPADMDNGGQACLPFGPKESATFILPRGGRDANAAPAAPRAQGGGGGGRGTPDPNAPCAAEIAAERAAAGGGRGAGAAGGADAAAAGGGRGNQTPRPPVTATIDQLGFLVSNWDTKKVEASLKRFGLDPKADGDSFHIVDPFGLDVQICGPKMGAY